MYERQKGDGCITVGEHKPSENNMWYALQFMQHILGAYTLSFPSTIVDCNFLYESGVLSSQMVGRIGVIFVFSFIR